MIKSLELQKVVINSIKNIDYLQKNDVKIFTSVPLKAKPPYIKIVSISMAECQQNANIDSFLIDLFVITNSKNNSKILEIMECLRLDFEDKINQYIDDEKAIINIFNIHDAKYNILEDLQSNFWNGHFYINIDLL